MKNSIFFIVMIFCSFDATGQYIIKLQNPSFEGVIGQGQVPLGWYNCGSDQESPPDIHGLNERSLFGVSQKPYDGNTYIGLVVRDNNSWEAVGQKLTVPLQGGECYMMNMYLSRSNAYFSISRTTGQNQAFNAAAIVTIWGGYDNCNKAELLAQSSPIENLEWLDYQFLFEPSKTYTHIVIEAYFAGNAGVAYNGNVLIDDISPITVANCQEGVSKVKEIDNELKMKTLVKSPKDRISNLDSLKSSINRVAPQLVYKENQDALTGDAERIFIAICRAKLDFSRYKLVFELKEKDTATANAKLERLELLIRQHQFPKQAYAVTVNASNEAHLQWLEENDSFKIGLVDRLKGLF